LIPSSADVEVLAEANGLPLETRPVHDDRAPVTGATGVPDFLDGVAAGLDQRGGLGGRPLNAVPVQYDHLRLCTRQLGDGPCSMDGLGDRSRGGV